MNILTIIGIRGGKYMDTKELDIIDIAEYGDALRSTGYKNIESAISEIIDNSVEAKAENMFVILCEEVGETNRKQVKDIYFLDDGTGMTLEVLHKSLRLGSGTKKGRKGIGRFGVGLPQSSMYATSRVEVYSWIEGYKNAYMTSLDIEEVKNGQQSGFPYPCKTELPAIIIGKYIESNLSINHSFKTSGTLVVWKDCDNIVPSTFSALKRRLEKELGRRFRYLIANGKTDLRIINDNTSWSGGIHKVIPNDPLLLMDNNQILGDTDEPQVPKSSGVPIFKPFDDSYENGIYSFEQEYVDKETKEIKTAPVTIKFSIIKEEFYDQDAFPGKNPGISHLGKEIAKLEGISIVRANREIDFGRFDFYSDKNSPYHRWWGCEISFNAELDEVFGVSNNKQHVELIKIDEEEYDDFDRKPIWIKLNSIISNEINNMVKRNKVIRQGSRQGEPVDQATGIINKVDQGDVETVSGNERITVSEDELIEEAKIVATESGIDEPTDDVISNIISNKVNFIYEANSAPLFFDYRHRKGIVECVINTEHEFYQKFVDPVINANIFNKQCFQLLVGSMARIFDETIDEDRRKIHERFIQKWGMKLAEYMDEVEG